jgi:hypothetical protein
MNNRYFEVTVSILISTLKNGKDKFEREIYLVDAMTVTEAEARVVKHFSGVNLEYRIVTVRQSKIKEVLEVTA